MEQKEAGPAPGRRHFTVAEANSALPRVARLVGTLQSRYKWLDDHRQEPRFMIARYRIVDEGPVDHDYVSALLGIRRALREIERIGAQIKDVRSGLVDFPARLDGREVLLCWRVGESRVGHWHDLESGFSGRQPLPASSLDPEPGGGTGS